MRKKDIEKFNKDVEDLFLEFFDKLFRRNEEISDGRNPTEFFGVAIDEEGNIHQFERSIIYLDSDI